jgi:hypothetical protein
MGFTGRLLDMAAARPDWATRRSGLDRNLGDDANNANADCTGHAVVKHRNIA